MEIMEMIYEQDRVVRMLVDNPIFVIINLIILLVVLVIFVGLVYIGLYFTLSNVLIKIRDFAFCSYTKTEVGSSFFRIRRSFWYYFNNVVASIIFERKMKIINPKYKKYQIMARPIQKGSNHIYYVIFNECAFHRDDIEFELGTKRSLEDAKDWIDNNPKPPNLTLIKAIKNKIRIKEIRRKMK